MLNIDFTETIEEDNSELLELLKDRFQGYIVEELGKLKVDLRKELDSHNEST